MKFKALIYISLILLTVHSSAQNKIKTVKDDYSAYYNLLQKVYKDTNKIKPYLDLMESNKYSIYQDSFETASNP